MSRNATRSATENDVESGRAAYWVPDGRSQPYELGISLPTYGVLRVDIGNQDPIKAGETVQVIQAELIDGTDVLLGFVWKGQMGVCDLHEVEIKGLK